MASQQKWLTGVCHNGSSMPRHTTGGAAVATAATANFCYSRSGFSQRCTFGNS